MADIPGPDWTALLARNRDLEEQLQAQRHEAAEREQQLEQQAAQLVEMERRMQEAVAEAKEEARQLARREASYEAAEWESTKEELQSLRRRMRYYEHDEGEQMLLFVARRLMETWDAETQRGMLLVTKTTYAELLPLVTRAVLPMTQPCSFAGAIGLQELTIELQTKVTPTYVHSELSKWSHLTGLCVLVLVPRSHIYREWMFPASISNLASLSTMHIRGMHPTGLQQLSALTRLTSLHVTHCELDYGALPMLPSLQALHVEDYDHPRMQQVASQPNLTKLHLRSCGTCIDDFEQLTLLTRLQELGACQDLLLVSLEPLALLTALTHLDLEEAGLTRLTSLQPLTALAQLRVLNLCNTRVENLAPLAQLTALEHLDISKCGDRSRLLLDVGPLTLLTGLKTINIDCCWLRNGAVLAGMQHLTVLGEPQRSQRTFSF